MISIQNTSMKWLIIINGTMENKMSGNKDGW